VTKGPATRATILDQAVDTAYAVGLGGLSIGVLATRSEMSKSGLFAHFGSKEALQLAVLEHAREDFIARVIRPALATPRGESRVRELFTGWLRVTVDRSRGSCLFVKAATELEGWDGPVREQLVRDHRDLFETVALVFSTGISEGHFAADADPEQFAHDLHGILLAVYHARGILEDPAADNRAWRAFQALLEAARP